jgi:hypothetical protein
MSKTKVSATTLSDTFVRRLAVLFPDIQITGFEVEALGGGQWQPRSFRDPIPDPILTEAFALLREMQSQFELAEVSLSVVAT